MALLVSDESDLPVIDLSLFSSPFINLNQDHLQNHVFTLLRKACQEFGFFQVINHGVSSHVIQAVDAMTRQMFELPVEVKNRANFPIFYTGYRPPEVDHVANDSRPECVTFSSDTLLPNAVEKICAKLWPQGNPSYCEELNAYKSQVMGLSKRILKLIILSLGVDLSRNSALFDKVHGNLRMNYYDKCSDKEMISKAHTDISCLTVLYQDDVGGLQIRTKTGKWMDTKPLPGSFVINVGDCLQMWSNGRYRSAEHRVVYGRSGKNRLSMAYFLDFPDEFEIRCPEEVIDQQHPQRYKVVTRADVVDCFKKVGPNLTIPMYFTLQ